MKYIITTAFLGILFTLSGATFSQSNVDKKIDEIDGTINKITITAEGKDYTFEGADAEKLFNRMKKSKSSSYVWHTSDDGISDKKVVFIDKDGSKEIVELDDDDADVFIVRSDDDFEWETDGIQKKVKVEVENGEKKVTVTTKENGEETTEVYEGDDADEYIEKMKAENDEFNIEIKSDSNGKKVKKIIIETEKEESTN